MYNNCKTRNKIPNDKTPVALFHRKYLNDGKHSFRSFAKTIIVATSNGKHPVTACTQEIVTKSRSTSPVGSYTHRKINNKTVESRFKKLGSADFCKAYKIEISNFRKKKHNTPHKAITTPLRKLSGDMLCSEILKTEFQSIYRLIINAKNEINTVTPPIKM